MLVVPPQASENVVLVAVSSDGSECGQSGRALTYALYDPTTCGAQSRAHALHYEGRRSGGVCFAAVSGVTPFVAQALVERQPT